MMKASKYIPLTLLLAGYGTTVIAEDQRYPSMQALGEVNGIALHCQYLGEIQRIKRAIVATVPKERVYGLAFETSTNDGFLAFIKSGEACPGPEGFKQEIDQRIQDMQKAFAAKAGEQQ
ncbi:hypothetical protein [Solemya velum gill symbiont]|uniref:Uncharacterized protein n=2 Tax=Solemya velum gill symbiont TaxID=2340 RepID=A0A0B0H7G4_SOVGS|nr:hypothetical protein [Solemya velum gill symbiont]KHF24602.1 hypothetical protein JV46_04400 [Solemya velum gill symbiont]OOY33865.1 hypothetical protein BOV88_12970 [Solemya velum gill symbiont]OOY36484.1 hypothetical protein BOV89_12295 [Solemya velum gill symbiont]OOY39075.1 hypothetical protein BOV90_11215 [Solemya velum gill symbiont]OOY42010.1 hypothetical protein BOV91_08455 [Solemya velum gill symbiont]